MKKRLPRVGLIRTTKPSVGSAGISLAVLKNLVNDDSFWVTHLQQVFARGGRSSVHLGIFVEPYLDYVLTGRKTIESRFSAVRCAPYGRVRRGDVLLLKASGGPVVGICSIGQTWSYQLDPDSWGSIRREFTEALCAQDPGFWTSRKSASFATLMQIQNVKRVEPLPWVKRDRRGWVVVKSPGQQTLFGAP